MAITVWHMARRSVRLFANFIFISHSHVKGKALQFSELVLSFVKLIQRSNFIKTILKLCFIFKRPKYIKIVLVAGYKLDSADLTSFAGFVGFVFYFSLFLFFSLI